MITQVLHVLQLCKSHVGEEPKEETKCGQDALSQYSSLLLHHVAQLLCFYLSISLKC